MYFNNFDKLYYDYTINGKTELLVVTDIVKNVRVRKEILANITLYDEYDIMEGETPEIIAEKIYGNPQYHWIIMLVNERFNYIDDFPLTYVDLEKHIKQKYGVDGMYDTHHYEDDNGNVVSFPNININGETSPSYPVSNYEYEDRLNESKRRIKIISKDLIDVILKNFANL